MSRAHLARWRSAAVSASAEEFRCPYAPLLPSSPQPPCSSRRTSASAASGRVTTYNLPAGSAGPFGITAGPGGVWFSRAAPSDRIRAGGDHGVPAARPAEGRVRLTWVGGDTVWFADQFNNRIDRLDTVTGTVSLYAVPTASAELSTTGHFRVSGHLPKGASPHRVVVGPDQLIWFTELNTNQVGQVTASRFPRPDLRARRPREVGSRSRRPPLHGPPHGGPNWPGSTGRGSSRRRGGCRERRARCR